ncbi:hypothetical protein MHBO_003812, partial [Bonamia ostreae]
LKLSRESSLIIDGKKVEARKFTNLRLKNKICNYYSETKKISFDNNNFPFIPPVSFPQNFNVLRQSPYRNYRYYQDLNKICNNEVNLDNYYKKFANTKSFVYPNLPKPVVLQFLFHIFNDF